MSLDSSPLQLMRSSPGSSLRSSSGKPWKILIVDDEPEVHTVTELALRSFRFADRPLSFLHAYSGEESIAIMQKHEDIAVVLMDVVMETEHAGLDAVDTIRNQLNNRFCRIILRTGHPGQAPEIEIITRYDIDDYKEKTELTAKKLFTSVYTGVRSYRDLLALDRNRIGLEKVVEASSDLMQRHGPAQFAEGVLEQVGAIMYACGDALLIQTEGFASTVQPDGGYDLVAATGRFTHFESLEGLGSLEPEVARRVRECQESSSPVVKDNFFSYCIHTKAGHSMVMYLESDSHWNHIDTQVLELFGRNVAVALENLILNEQVNRTQRELILMLGEAIEERSKETGNHVRRVAEYSALLGRLINLPESEVRNLQMAAPLHDVGKIAIEDRILHKPGRHTEEEAVLMREHARIGAELFSGHELPVLTAAGIIAGEHHEHWDGQGYPNGKSGEDIHLFGRIVAIADVFDALLSARCYKEPWSLDDTLDFMRQERGRKFDPQLIDLLLANLPDFLSIRERLRDDQDQAA